MLEAATKTRTPHLSFDRVARQYDSTRFMPETVALSLARFVHDGLTDRDWTLDAGIGTGRVGRALAAGRARTVGVDVSARMMAQMVAGSGDDCRSPHLVLADVRALPFADGAFARVLAVHLLHLIPEWEDVLGEFWRVLAPGGRFVFGVEDRTATEVREFYLGMAAGRGLLPPHPGAHSRDVVGFLEDHGVAVSAHRSPEWSWTYTVSVSETLAGLRERVYSLLWQVPEADHREMLTATERFARERFGPGDATETVTARMILYVAAR